MEDLNVAIDDLSKEGYSGKEAFAEEVKVTTSNPAVLRFLDGPNAFITYQMSWILCDSDEKIRPFIIKNTLEGYSLLGKMFGNRDEYYKGGYFETVPGEFGKVATYQAKDPSLYKDMTEYWNAAFGNIATAKPKLEYIYECIHRNPEVIENVQAVWCQKKKHTKIVRLGQNGLKSLKKCVDDDGDIREYDVNYTKEGTGKATNPDIRRAGINVPYAVAGFLTEEEKNYERYDLKRIVRLSSAFYCLKHLQAKIQRMDAAMGTNYHAEFIKQAAIENVQFQEKLEHNKSSNSNIEVPPRESINVMTPPQAVMQPNSQQALPFDDSRIPMGPQTHQEAPKRVLAGTPPTVPCFQCGTLVPQNALKCHKCGCVLMEPCAVCSNVISSKATSCVFCGASYTVS